MEKEEKRYFQIKRKMNEVPIIYFGEGEFNEDKAEIVNSRLLEKLIDDTFDFIETMHYSMNPQKQVTNHNLAKYFYRAYSKNNIPGGTQRERESYLEQIRKSNVLNGIEKYFEKNKKLLLPHTYWNIPLISEKGGNYPDYIKSWKIPKKEALKFLKKTNIFELQTRGRVELNYTSGLFMDEIDGKFYIIHSNKINYDTCDLISPQINSVLELKDRINVLDIKFELKSL